MSDWLVLIAGTVFVIGSLVYAAASWDPTVCARVPGCTFVAQHIEGPVVERITP